MRSFMIAAPSSGSGKTAVTCGLLELLAEEGYDPCSFKCGPDYIDPMFHRSVLGIPSCNLDLFLAPREIVRENFRRYSAGHGAALVEGVMGFYDGAGGTTTEAGSWHLADTLDLPVILVVRPKGMSLTLAAQIRGLLSFRENSHIAGILLNDCSSMYFHSLREMLERETGVPVLGYLPHMAEAAFPSRHLGLITAGEIEDLRERIRRIAGVMRKTVDLDRLMELACVRQEEASAPEPRPCETVRIAFAQDRAFCFLYEETLDRLRDLGAELVPFSPIEDSGLPADVHGLYLPGGYPELFARELSGNRSMRRAVREAVKGGMPAVAECGGFLYLGGTLENEEGRVFEMAGALPGNGIRRDHLVRFGYGMARAKADSMLLRAGEIVPVHEFHYWDSTANGDCLSVTKPVSGRSWEEAFTTETLYAGFPHLYLAGKPEAAARFVAAAGKQAKGE
ncbi:MAG: cobyrinate a,c-diamide synthase [Eubacterium pyruvativorans]|uniref:cobyrinate a,c-diamide synthase n=1 Tax=Eubacterium pyruvativorans TaxID=155865 RepID=UPI002A80091A|nr:cobyrinate a,c-diamide synthase [Eubacterium pyruvativorans]MDY4049255.1 cobyrinate a,c-diamide synthase [Eubacterium pyruvativorans]